MEKKIRGHCSDGKILNMSFLNIFLLIIIGVGLTPKSNAERKIIITKQLT